MSFTPGAGTRFLVTSTTNPSGGSTTLLGPLNITGGTATANAPVLNATQTWNNAAVTFTGWQLNVTDTASNFASLLMDLQVGGGRIFSFSKNGQIIGIGNSGRISFNQSSAAVTFGTSTNDSRTGYISSAAGLVEGLSLASDLPLRWSSTTNAAQSPDILLFRDAGGALAQRNGVNAQTFRVYNTFTDASNYERGIFSWSANALSIGTQAAGTGALRELQLRANDIFFNTGNAFRWYISSTGIFLPYVDNSFDIGSGGNRIRNLFVAGYQEMSEMTAPAAPAANSVRIYAVDNGSGKTQLMALFATGAAQQIAIEP